MATPLCKTTRWVSVFASLSVVASASSAVLKTSHQPSHWNPTQVTDMATPSARQPGECQSSLHSVATSASSAVPKHLISQVIRIQRKSLKTTRIQQTNAIYKKSLAVEELSEKAAKVNAELNKAKSELAQALLERTEEQVQHHDFVRVLDKVLSGTDSRPMLWLDIGRHEYAHYLDNTIEVAEVRGNDDGESTTTATTKPPSLVFCEAPVQDEWNKVEHLFDLKRFSVTYNLKPSPKKHRGDYDSEDEENEGPDWIRESIVGIVDVFKQPHLNMMFHSFVLPIPATIDFDRLIKDERENFALLSGDKATFTFHLIKATLKPQQEQEQ